MRARSLIVVALLVAFGAAACGSSSKGASGPTATTSGGSSATSAPSSPGAAPKATAPPVVGGSGGGNFCDLARKDQNAFSGSSAAAVTPAALKTEFENIGPALQHAEQIAPSAIKPDFQVFLNAFTPYLQALAAANYDFSKLNFQDPKLQELASPQVKTASDHIEAYFTSVCHITTPST
jgi:hypothetical protein